VGVYTEHFLPRFQDLAMRRKGTRQPRARVCADLQGDVLEVGFGTGLNAPYYPSGVTRIMAVEPSAVCMKIARRRIAGSPVPVDTAGLTGERLEVDSESVDAVLSTWTLCTIPNLAAALAEMRRVLKPGGALHFVEHGHAPDRKVERWQQRFEPMNKRLAGGCHLTRRIPDLIEQAGFAVDRLDTYYMEGEPRPFGYTYEGRATKG
jgi:ubiquinone/menaquinone biosynthesis C-methylase UbiE